SDGKKPSETWLLQHIPYWVSIKCAADPCVQPVGNSPLDAMRQWMRNDTASPKFDLLLSGDTHMFQFFVPEKAEIPEQVIAGMGGGLLEQRSDFEAVLDRAVGAKLFGVEGRLLLHHQFGFLMLTRQDDGWTATFHDVDGTPTLRCRLDKAARARAMSDFPCSTIASR